MIVLRIYHMFVWLPLILFLQVFLQYMATELKILLLPQESLLLAEDSHPESVC